MFIKKIFTASIIIFCAALLGLAANAISPNGISLQYSKLTNNDLPDQFQPMPEISIEEAKSFFDSGEAVFIDARMDNFYRDEHIEGALNLPYYDFSTVYDEISKKINKTDLIITYCSEVDCELSQAVAKKLKLNGYTNIKVMVGGLEEWIIEGFPTVYGGAP